MVLKSFRMSFPRPNILFGSDYIFLTQDITRVKNLLIELEGVALKMERLYFIKRMAKGNILIHVLTKFPYIHMTYISYKV